MLFHKGDVVRIGSGKVDYTVLNDVTTESADIESKNTGKAQTVKADRLMLVTAAPVVSDNTDSEYYADMAERDDIDFSAMPGPVAIPTDAVLAAWEVELMHPVVDGRPFLLTIDGSTVGFRSYDRAAFELSRYSQDSYTWAAIDHNGQRKAARGTAA